MLKRGAHSQNWNRRRFFYLRLAKTLGTMLTIALLGLPVVIAYTVSIYWIFRGKVRLDAMSY